METLSHIFIKQHTKEQKIKEQFNEMELFRIKKFAIQKTQLTKIQVTNFEKIVPRHIYNQMTVFRMYKELVQLR